MGQVRQPRLVPVPAADELAFKGGELVGLFIGTAGRSNVRERQLTAAPYTALANNTRLPDKYFSRRGGSCGKKGFTCSGMAG